MRIIYRAIWGYTRKRRYYGTQKYNGSNIEMFRVEAKAGIGYYISLL
ncbi:MAG: hypothetical protein HFI78_06200 [Lachnospiraceae bacterium]|nr:hypothetical protein [Lachnospiraceae bacterium]